MYSISQHLSLLLMSSNIIASVMAENPPFRLMAYDKLAGSDAPDINTPLSKQLINNKENIKRLINEAKIEIQEQVQSRNEVQRKIRNALIAGASLGLVKYYINAANRTDLQGLLITSQILQGYGYAGYQANQIENPDLSCGVEDFLNVLSRYERDPEKNSPLGFRRIKLAERHTDIVESLWCLFKFQYKYKYFQPSVKVQELDRLLYKHLDINEALLENEKSAEELDLDAIDRKSHKEYKLKLMDIARFATLSLKVKTNDTIENISNSGVSKRVMSFGTAIIGGSLLEVLGLSMLENREKDNFSSFPRLANYGFLGFYGLGFGWPVIAEATALPGYTTKCEAGMYKNEIEAAFNFEIIILENIENKRFSQARSAVQDMVWDLDISLTCLKNNRNDLEVRRIFLKIKELEAIFMELINLK